MKKHGYGSLVWGAALIGVGVGYMGNAFGWWRDFTFFFPGWWTLFIIVPCLASILDSGFNSVNGTGLLVGAFLLATRINSFGSFFKFIIPAVLISAGVMIILRSRMFRYRRVINESTGEDRYIPIYNTFFNSRSVAVNGEQFDGASVMANFGGLRLDLTNALFAGESLLDVSSFCANVELIFPSDVNVKVSSTPVVGVTNNKLAKRPVIPGAPTIFVNATAVLGGVEIR